MKLSDYTLITPTSNKAVTLQQFNDERLWRETTWDSHTARNKQADINQAANFKDLIGVIYRCVELRADAVASIPFVVFQNETPIYNSNITTQDTKYPWLDSIQALLNLTEASLLLSSEAFWLKNTALAGNIMSLRWLAAPYVTPLYDEVEGIVGFKRTLGKNDEIYDRDSIIYSFIQDPLSELMPEIPQVLAAATSAKVVLSYEDFVAKFYERGGVKASILSVDRSVPPKERTRLRDFWENFMTGGKNAWTTEVISADVDVNVIGEGVGDSEKTEILTSRRRDIATSLGVPYSLLFESSSSSYTSGPTEIKNFLNFTIIPRVKLIQRSLNQQLFIPLGLKIRFLTDSLPAFRDASETESKIFVAYTNSLIPHSVAAQLAGITLPEGIKYEDLDVMVAKERERQFREKEQIVTLNSKIGVDSNTPKEDDGPQAQAKPIDPDKLDNNIRSLEIGKYRKWLKNRKNRDIDPYSFESDVLGDDDKLEVYKSFIEEHGGSNDKPPFSLSDTKAIVTIEDEVEPDGLTDLEDEHSSALTLAFDAQLAASFPEDYEMNEEEFFSFFRRSFEANSSLLHDSLLIMMLGFAALGVESASRKVSRYAPGFNSDDSYYQARIMAQERADNAFRLIQEATMRRAESIFAEYKRGSGLGLAWVVSELKKFVNAERARVIATNESMVVVREAEKIVYTNSKIVKLVRWYTAKDEKVCAVCGPRHGRVYPLFGAPMLPAHVRCRCALLPMVDTKVVNQSLYV